MNQTTRIPDATVKLVEQVLAEAPTGYALADLDGALLCCNPAFRALQGETVGAVSGAALAGCFDPSEAERIGEWFSAAMADRTPEPAATLWLSGEDGVRRQAAVDITLIRDEAGAPAGLLLAARATAAADDRDPDVLPDLSVGLWRHDPATDAMVFNTTAKALLGYSDNDLPCSSLSQLLDRHRPEPPDDNTAGALDALGMRNGAGGLPQGLPRICRMRRTNGQWSWMLWHRTGMDTAAASSTGPLTGVVQDITDVVEALLQARSAQRVLELASAASDGGEIGLWCFEPTTGQVWQSDSWHRMLGYDPEDQPKTIARFTDLLHPEDRDRVEKDGEKAFASADGRYSSDFRMRRQDGSYAWIGARGRVIDDPNVPGGRVMVGAQTDISARIETSRQLEAAARTAQVATERLERLTANVPGGLYEFVIDADGQMSFPYAAPKSGPLLGTTSEAMCKDATAGFACIHPDDLPGFQEAIVRSQESLELFNTTIRIEHPEHGLRWLRVTSTPEALPEGGVIWFGSLFDVTEEVGREQELATAAETARLATARLERLNENVPGGIFEFVIDAAGEASFTYVSPDMGPLLGTTTEALLSDAEAGFMHDHPEDAALVQAAIEESSEDLSVLKINHRLNHPELGLRWHRVHATPEALGDGGVAWYGSIFDVTEEMDREQILESTAEIARDTSARLERLTDNVPGGIFEFAIDAEGQVSFPYANSGMGPLLGTTSETILTDPAAGFARIHPDDAEGLQAAIDLSRETLGLFKHSYRIQHPEHGLRWIRVNSTPVKHADGTIVWYGSLFDVTEEVEREQELQSAAERARVATARMERLTENVPGGIYEFIIDAEGEMSFPYATSGMGRLLGTTSEILTSDPAAAFTYVHPEDAPAVSAAIMESRETRKLFSIKYRIEHPELGLRWIQAKSTPEGKPDGAVMWYGSLFDVTEEVERAQELEAARNRMEHLSLIDSLTGLPNRRACDEEMAARSAEDMARTQAQTVIRIDLDHFKAVNDTLGHSAGDAVLCRVGDCLRETIGTGDFAARLGGDEFVILLAPGQGAKDAVAMIRRLRAVLLRPFTFEGRHCRFDASFGYATTEEVSGNLVELLSFADAALLSAKDAGRGRSAMFTGDMHEGLIRNRRRAGEIQLAIEREEFVPYFHPQIDAATGGISGFEVLARWHHPQEGKVPPDDFIPVAQQMRVVQDIDRMMFSKALDTLGRLQDDGLVLPKLSFNVSAGRVHDPDIVQSVRKLQTNGTQVAFELLESILLEEEGALFEHHIDILKDCGIEIEVDDFGSGRASIIGVLRVAPDTIKIDRRLIAPLFDSRSMRGLVRAIIDIGQSLDIDITAEGVETMDHAWALREMGCRTLQGYAFARPMPEEELKVFLESFRPVFDTRPAARKA